MDSLRNELERHLDQLIGQRGLNWTVRVLKRLSQLGDSQLEETDRNQLITAFLKREAIKLFKLTDEDFDLPTEVALDALKIIVHLTKCNTGCSWRTLGDYLNLSKRKLKYHRNRCTEMLMASGYYRDFAWKYEELEKKLLDFMTKME